MASKRKMFEGKKNDCEERKKERKKEKWLQRKKERKKERKKLNDKQWKMFEGKKNGCKERKKVKWLQRKKERKKERIMNKKLSLIMFTALWHRPLVECLLIGHRIGV